MNLSSRVVLALAATACAADLSLPAPPSAASPPLLASVAPSEAFAGEVLTLRGEALGSAAAARVLVGGVMASPAPVQPPGGLAVIFPEDLPPGPLDVSVATGQGESRLAGAVRSLGLGHPRGLDLQATRSQGAFLVDGLVSGGRAYLLDYRHDALFGIDTVEATLGPDPIGTSNRAIRIFGTANAAWVLTRGPLDAPAPGLERYDLTADPPVLSCPPTSLAPLVASVEKFAYGAASADGALLALPDGAQGVVLVDLTTCPPQARRVALDQIVYGVLVDGRDVVAATYDRFVRITAAGEVVPGPSYADEDDTIDHVAALALQSGAHAAAYRRYDHKVGFLEWDPVGGPVRRRAQTIPNTVDPKAIAWGAPSAGGAASDRLYVSGNDLLLAFDVSPQGVALRWTTLGRAPAKLLPVPDGSLLGLQEDWTALWSREGGVLRVNTAPVDLLESSTGAAVGGDGRLVVPSTFGIASIAPDLSGADEELEPGAAPLVLDGVTGTGGTLVGWSRTRLLLQDPSTHRWRPFGDLPADWEVRHATVNAAGDRAVVVATVVVDDKALYRFVSVTAGGAKVVPENGATAKARFAWAGGDLWFAWMEKSTHALHVGRVDPDTLAPLAPEAVLPAVAGFSRPLMRDPRWSRALGALVVPVDELAADETATASMLYAVRPDGTSTSLRSPTTRTYTKALGLSPDGRMLVCASRLGTPAIAAGLLDWTEQGLSLTPYARQTLPSLVHSAAFSPDGASLYVVFWGETSVGLCQ